MRFEDRIDGLNSSFVLWGVGVVSEIGKVIDQQH